MMTEIDLDAKKVQPRRPWAITVVGLLVILGMVALPFIFGEPDGEKRDDLVRFFGHFHPLVLHLPIGIFLLIILQEFLGLFHPEMAQRRVFPVFLGTASAVMAMLLGFLLYHGGGFEGSELAEDHMWGGIVFACAAVATLVVRWWVVDPGISTWFYRFVLLGTVGAMGYASHDGASITHGSDYLIDYAPDPIRKLLGEEPKEKKEEQEKIPLEQQVVYADIVQPILNLRCVECHKEEKSKGKLRLDTFDLIVKGGKEGSSIDPGDADNSNIIFRAELPEDDEEHMPPEGKTDIEDHELAILKWWINEGADPLVKVGDLDVPDEIRKAIGELKMTVSFIEHHVSEDGGMEGGKVSEAGDGEKVTVPD